MPFFILSLNIFVFEGLCKTLKNALKNADLQVHYIFGSHLITSTVNLSKNVNWLIAVCVHVCFFFNVLVWKISNIQEVERWLQINSHVPITRLLLSFMWSILWPIPCSTSLHYFRATPVSSFQHDLFSTHADFKICVIWKQYSVMNQKTWVWVLICYWRMS